jgi:hypothetical protein
MPVTPSQTSQASPPALAPSRDERLSAAEASGPGFIPALRIALHPLRLQVFRSSGLDIISGKSESTKCLPVMQVMQCNVQHTPLITPRESNIVLSKRECARRA